jgi:hypothetical protein
MSLLRTEVLFGLVTLTVVAAASTAHAQSTVGTITQLQGVASVERNGAPTPAMLNEPVLLHDKIVTNPNASLTIGLVDNSFLQLASSSTLTMDEGVIVNGVGAPSKVGLLSGSLHSVIVGAMRGSSTTFEVNTPNAVGAVRGTDFWIHFDRNPRP